MIQGLIKKVFGTRHDREMKKMQPLIDRIGAFEDEFKKLSDDDLKAKTDEFRRRYAEGETLDDLLPEAFATCRAASVRVLGMRHYDVQLIGGIVMHRGEIAEMKTGEGKTLTATLALYLNAIAGKGAHLVTVNDYLASRDAEWMGQLYNWLGMSTGIIVPDLSDAERQAAYAADITYGTNNEFGFDYLRDNMKFDLARKVQRPLNFAIVDEVDSILIDEARTPLIISGKAEQNSDMYYEANEIVAYLKRDEHYIVDEEHRAVSLTEEGVDRVEDRLGIRNLFEPANIDWLHHVNKALEAHTLYKRDEKYIVRDNKIVIVDDFTGRLMPGRRWSDGLHQAIEAKEGVKIEDESVTLATVTFQNFFRMYEKLAGMTGTADTEAEEFGKIYDLGVTVIPTNRPIQRLDQPDVIYRTEREKFTAIVDQILECHEKGQPVLVGTVNVDKSEVISKVLEKKGIPHSVLNAKFHANEAQIVAQAGRKGAVTIATNMAGRGTDILLGGNPAALAAQAAPDETSQEYAQALEKFREICAREKEEVLAAGGLFILGTERHDSRRIDNQLRGRAGRQGDPGESRFFLSLEDELMRRFGAEKIQGIMQRLGMEDGVPLEHKMVSRAIENSQRRVEGKNFDQRKNLLEYDDVMDVQRKTVYELRDQILAGEDLKELVLDALSDSLQALLLQYIPEGVKGDQWDFEGFCRAAEEALGITVDPEAVPRERNAMERHLWAMVEEALEAKIDQLQPFADRHNKRAEEAAEAARRAREEAPEGAEDIPPLEATEFTPRTKEDVFDEVAQLTYLRELDKRYRDHLQAMRTLREQVSLHGYAQKDPKQIYKKEGYELFETFTTELSSAVAKLLMRLQIQDESALEQAQQAQRAEQQRQQQLILRGSSGASAQPAPRAVVPAGFAVGKDGSARREVPKIGRNELCWCGSGKKYKHCHMRSDAAGETAPPPADPFAGKEASSKEDTPPPEPKPRGEDEKPKQGVSIL